MNYLLSLLLCFSLMSKGSCSNDRGSKKVPEVQNTIVKKFPAIQFETVEHDFGNIKRGNPVFFIFKFKNVGDAPLVIVDARSSCGCTVPEKPKKPVNPGENGEIKVNYNASGSGKITKIVTLITNTEKGRETLKIEAFVEDK